MARVPEYFRSPLRSERTSINSADISGQTIANTARNIANTFSSKIAAVEREAKALRDKSVQNRAVGEYTTEMMEGAQKDKE